jgi:GntR family transcriptional repressor for pyruvate dehydrogenase complex
MEVDLMSSPIIFRTIGNKERLVDRVVEEVKKLVINRKLLPGMMLPPERELADQIGVSRTVVREAVQVLTAMGLVESRQGIGTIIRQANGDQLSEQLNLMLQTKGFTLDNLHHVRSILEVEIADLAARQAAEEEISELNEIVERMEAQVGDPIAYAESDAEFHRCLAKISHNPLLVLLLDSISDILREVRLSVSKHPDIFLKALPDHRQILERVQERDSEGGRQAMRLHLEHAREIQDQVVQQKSSADQVN